MTASLFLLVLASLTGEPSSSHTERSTAPPASRAESLPVQVRAVEASAPRTERVRYSLDEILTALRKVETGGERNEGRHATGDGGVAIGPYQIHRAYWIDARLPGRFEDCRDPRYARAVVIAYWRRYCPKALVELDAQTLTRVHNGGPDGHREDCTLKFWRKVDRELVKLRAAPAAPVDAPKSEPAKAPNPSGAAARPILV